MGEVAMERADQASNEQTALAGGAVLTTVRGGPGPTVALLGGVHGDEDEGVLAVLRVVRELAGAPLAGTVRAVARAHAAAWAAGSRTGPLDGGNLARCFPGDPKTGPTAGVAASITESVIDGADVLIDLHSAGVAYRMPLFCGFIRDAGDAEGSSRAATAFGAPLIWAHSGAPPGRSLSVAADLGIPAVYAECGGGGGIRGEHLDAYTRGVLGVLAEFGLLPPSWRPPEPAATTWVYDGGGDLDAGVLAAHDGFFVSAVDAGERVTPGAEIGRLHGYDGALLETVTAPAAGMVMFLRRRARTRAGDVLFALAGLDDGGLGDGAGA
ncbi:succinylglutamate desuccinylase/aspartoacylase family protein [Jiangella mangrovi]|uniref:Putative deacylase n=1 Tax=Jiangella mangrovi TaxID=1524084 RepID=A0A7W9GX37_9ACTN|nr:M14 family metallopeptidase [Jiangella mangrovi]MBB5791655.1 putative deacylase [Jiangella mangrovi]